MRHPETQKYLKRLPGQVIYQIGEGPVESERPSAYIIIIGDKTISSDFHKDYMYTNSGIICQSILLGAAEKGIGGCIFASIQRNKLSEIYNLTQELEIMLVIALASQRSSEKN